MSKYMQIKVAVTPFYQGEFGQAYPRLARHLGYLDRPLVDSNPSLYALTAQLDKLLYTFDGTKLREVLLRHREKLQGLKANIDENLAVGIWPRLTSFSIRWRMSLTRSRLNWIREKPRWLPVSRQLVIEICLAKLLARLVVGRA